MTYRGSPEEIAALKIGDTLWHQDDNGRLRWCSAKVLSETKLSWIVADPKYADAPTMHSKVNKKTMLESLGRYGHRRWYTVAQKDAKDWRDQHCGPIMNRVQFADADQLRQIAAIVGYDPEAQK